VRQRLLTGEVDVLTFASPSSVRNLADLLGGERSILAGSAVACVGPVTAGAAREVGLRVDVVAEGAMIAELVAALVTHRPRLDATRSGRGAGPLDGRSRA
jgi:uroporphyrinogen III methyltransferase/synthase